MLLSLGLLCMRARCSHKMKSFWNRVWHISGNERRPVAGESTELQLDKFELESVSFSS